MNELINDLKASGFECGIAIATEAEVSNGAACGQLSLVTEVSEEV